MIAIFKFSDCITHRPLCLITTATIFAISVLERGRLIKVHYYNSVVGLDGASDNYYINVVVVVSELLLIAVL